MKTLPIQAHESGRSYEAQWSAPRLWSKNQPVLNDCYHPESARPQLGAPVWSAGLQAARLLSPAIALAKALRSFAVARHHSWQERDIHAFILRRGGSFTDDMERQIEEAFFVSSKSFRP